MRLFSRFTVLLTILLLGSHLLLAGTMVLFNDTGSFMEGLRVVFDRPVEITQFGSAFTVWNSQQDGSTILFGNGSVDVWGDFYFMWKPDDAALLSYEWLADPPDLEASDLFAYWGFTVAGGWKADFIHPERFVSLQQLIGTGANSVTLAFGIPMDSSTGNAFSTPHTHIGCHPAYLRPVVGFLKAAGLEVSIKPAVQPKDDTWSAKLSPEDPKLWFSEYKEILLDYARLAEEVGVDVLYLSNELASMTANPDFKAYWLDIIAAVRHVFSGSLSINAIINTVGGAQNARRNIAQSEVMNIPFADELDFIGVSFCLPLTIKNDPTVAELVQAWTRNREGVNLVAALQEIAQRYEKPVMISEIAYRSADGNNKAPWEGGEVDNQEQADLFEALLRVLTSEGAKGESGWLRGVSIWGWFTLTDPLDPLLGSDDHFGPMGGAIQTKPAEETIREWYLGFQSNTVEGRELPAGSTDPIVVYDYAHEEEFAVMLEDALRVNAEHPERVLLPLLSPFVDSVIRRGPISVSSLEPCDVYIVAAPWEPLAPSEQDALLQFVNDGGGLLLIGNAAVDWAFDRLGVSFGSKTIGEPGEDGHFASFAITDPARHPLTEDVKQIYIRWSSTMAVSSEWQVVSQTSARSWQETTGWREMTDHEQPSPGEASGPFPVVAAREYGSGRIVALSNARMFADEDPELWWNVTLLDNILMWLAGSEQGQMLY